VYVCARACVCARVSLMLQCLEQNKLNNTKKDQQKKHVFVLTCFQW
jgi:hypothetical protein